VVTQGKSTLSGRFKVTIKKGTFSIAAKIPNLGASGGHVYGACYWNGNHSGGQNIDYSPYIQVEFTRS
jgi:hypothetical protein